MVKKQGRKMAGLGLHHSTTEGKRVKGHSLVGGLYLFLGRRCPLQPQLYRQRSVCQQEGVPNARKTDLVVALIRTFVPIQGTCTHVLLDTWYSAKRIWKAARDRGFLITTGLKKNRALRIADATAAYGWRWQRLDEYASSFLIRPISPSCGQPKPASPVPSMSMWCPLACGPSTLVR